MMNALLCNDCTYLSRPNDDLSLDVAFVQIANVNHAPITISASMLCCADCKYEVRPNDNLSRLRIQLTPQWWSQPACCLNADCNERRPSDNDRCLVFVFLQIAGMVYATVMVSAFFLFCRWRVWATPKWQWLLHGICLPASSVNRWTAQLQRWRLVCWATEAHDGWSRCQQWTALVLHAQCKVSFALQGVLRCHLVVGLWTHLVAGLWSCTD